MVPMIERIEEDTRFLADVLVDPNMIYGEPSQCRTEAGKRALELWHRFETRPQIITSRDIQDLIASEGSQVNINGSYLHHVIGAAEIFRGLVELFQETHPDINVPHPDVAYAHGLIHDLSTVITDSDNSGPDMRNFVDFFLAKRMGLKTVEKYTAMHGVHLEAMRLVFEGVNFPQEEVYVKLKTVLQGGGLLSYGAIEKQFREFMMGKGNFPLLLLTVADFTANGQVYFKRGEFEGSFEARTEDILERYCRAYAADSMPLIGKALLAGGLERIKSYKKIVSDMLSNDPLEVERLRKETDFFSD